MEQIKVSDLLTHRYAEITPNMIEAQFEALKLDIEQNGQLEPIKVWKHKNKLYVYDGRHRLKSIKELGLETIKAEVDDKATEEEIKTRVKSLENRRHQTPTQLAIMAFKEYKLLSENAESKESQESVAKRYGISRKSLAEVKTLSERAPELIEILFNGDKFNTGTTTNPCFTNNIRVINAFVKDDTYSRVGKPKECKLSQEELEFLETEAMKIIAEHGTSTAMDLAKRLFGILKPTEELPN